MWTKVIFLILISCFIIFYGILWYKNGLSSEVQYDFKEDFKHTFLTPHWTYSGYLHDGKPRRIVPTILILSGIGILAVGIIKILGEN